jgi:hypothetical protein
LSPHLRATSLLMDSLNSTWDQSLSQHFVLPRAAVQSQVQSHLLTWSPQNPLSLKPGLRAGQQWDWLTVEGILGQAVQWQRGPLVGYCWVGTVWLDFPEILVESWTLLLSLSEGLRFWGIKGLRLNDIRVFVIFIENIFIEKDIFFLS